MGEFDKNQGGKPDFDKEQQQGDGKPGFDKEQQQDGGKEDYSGGKPGYEEKSDQ